ncbi:MULTISPECIES: hypothetical protein [Aerococcus]|uniref:Uncharacterized protein n=1 Tax=Aerococcus mictus TaxID=2976810 RepID=A0A9Q4DDR5_9LACT|nr:MULTISPECIES: hypothetical protein [Aerococcus]MBU5611094.1 hypothetical protein [Aerococcus urinae]MCY3034007.1 hypothetical protein [Aerococcus mictus]MCY3065775.1 hypothetical protein [Aerococcus mictus]MCY3066469.1 hypothetical protein [Aerococcus mictus]MCY3071394.1 hypothetical protein [Aerococcus mictus]
MQSQQNHDEDDQLIGQRELEFPYKEPKERDSADISDFNQLDDLPF